MIIGGLGTTSTISSVLTSLGSDSEFVMTLPLQGATLVHLLWFGIDPHPVTKRLLSAIPRIYLMAIVCLQRCGFT
jgi:ABC-type antimicrobial peptide transport system permease subunit